MEGDACRGLFATGKCPTACATAMATVTTNASWTECELVCKDDVVAAGASRWAVLCGARAETLIDQGKEAMKSLVTDGFAKRVSIRGVIHAFVGLLILVLGVGFGYRRGAGAAQMAYRLQRRRRKNSDANISV